MPTRDEAREDVRCYFDIDGVVALSDTILFLRPCEISFHCYYKPCLGSNAIPSMRHNETFQNEIKGFLPLQIATLHQGRFFLFSFFFLMFLTQRCLFSTVGSRLIALVNQECEALRDLSPREISDLFLERVVLKSFYRHRRDISPLSLAAIRSIRQEILIYPTSEDSFFKIFSDTLADSYIIFF